MTTKLPYKILKERYNPGRRNRFDWDLGKICFDKEESRTKKKLNPNDK